ncbi:MerR family transcriptional regulator [Agromyces sp. Leaf222]|uniref:MerR family transcriptional regulator n=1 Tax=Agromyces sp. Leaf222 TaxID=1735688 RepID=UPI0006FCB3FC|nr:MerR family transcriptional regulator [Agromyces sp. Leaf222]KQM81234.1 MerR family transcriptional regulator [Agromyces sp. Leaf222]
MRIGEIARRAGVSTRLVRYYEQQGLLASTRESNGYRDYDEADVDRVQHIANLVQSGVATKLVKELLELEDAAAEARPSCPRAVAEMLAAELAGLEERIACLSRSRDSIRDYLARTEHTALVCERDHELELRLQREQAHEGALAGG